ncbi:hypothetical protein QP858_06505 [Trueperella bernardiae]|uniref:Helix-turn-helix domain-containing protein n=1 Tax=Trueperella bernardiae TaxID=59561 RepID=A0AAW6ZMH5_9ACTO|nr:hypothetical protein [Trueperella bernardiae]MDK8602103.1 hypothetical protein [Trueperella bernardiae]
MRERITAADIDWSALDDAAAALDDATAARESAMARASQAVTRAAAARASEIERLETLGVSRAAIANHLGISRQAVSAAVARYRHRRQDGDQDDIARPHT